MKMRCFLKNSNNKTEFTEEELKQLLDEVYNDGYSDGLAMSNRNHSWWWQPTPYREEWTVNTGTAAPPDYNTTSSSTIFTE